MSCPYCGGMGQVPDGVYDFVTQTRRVFQQLTPEQNRSMVQTLRRFEAGEIDEAAVEAEAPPEAKALIRSALDRADKKYWITMFAMVLLFLIQWQMSNDSTKAIQATVDRAQAAMAQDFRQLDQHEKQVCEQISQMMRQADGARNKAVAATRDLPYEGRCRPRPRSARQKFCPTRTTHAGAAAAGSSCGVIGIRLADE